MRKTKSEQEKELTEHILSVGLKEHIEMDEGNNTFYLFRLENGETRYWKNMSDDNLRRLKIIE